MSSACYVYAIVGREAASLTAHVVDGLSMVSYRELAAVIARMEMETVPITPDAVLRHEAVVERVRRQTAALPVRFGTVFRDEASVSLALARNYETLAADLERLGDKVELSLTALWTESPVIHAEPPRFTQGAQYLRARAAQFQRDDALNDRAQTIARAMDDVLATLALEHRVSLTPAARLAFRTTYLLDPGAVGGFRTALQEMHRIASDVRVVLTGPWPPYSFVKRTGIIS